MGSPRPTADAIKLLMEGSKALAQTACVCSVHSSEEEWKDVVGYEGYYIISSKGRAFALERSICMGRKGWSSATRKARKCNLFLDTKRYVRVALCRDGVSTNKKIHRLVASAFIANTENKPQVNHKDRNKQHNCVENLEWATAKEDSIHMWATGGRRIPKGSSVHTSKLTEVDVVHIRHRLQQGHKGKDIAKDLGVHPSLISSIKLGKIWKHVP